MLGGVPDKPLLTHKELILPGDRNGGIVIVGSHVNKTTRQLEQLRKSICPLEFIQFDQHLVLEEGGLEREVARVVALAQQHITLGRSVVVLPGATDWIWTQTRKTGSWRYLCVFLMH